MEEKKILVALQLNEQQRRTLLEAAQGCTVDFVPMGEITPEQAQSANIIIGNVSPEKIAASTKLEWLQTNSAGADAYIREGALAPNTIITNASGAYGLGVSEYMLAGWMSLLKNLHICRDRQKQHIWQDAGSQGTVWGSTVLVMGLGDIGQCFARRAKALGAAHIIGVRRTDAACPAYCDEIVLTENLDTVLSRADCVALFVPGGPATRNLFDAERLAKMKPGSVMVNGSRGSVVNTEALLNTLESGHLRGAVLDVTDPEPLPAEHPLWDAPNCIITPHNAGGFHIPQTLDRITAIAAHNLELYLSGQAPDNRVDRGHGYAVRGAGQGKNLYFEG